MALEINSKAEKAYEIISQANDKVIIFTEYRASQAYLQGIYIQKESQASFLMGNSAKVNESG